MGGARSSQINDGAFRSGAPPAKGMQKAIESELAKRQRASISLSGNAEPVVEAVKEQLDLPKSGPDEQIQPVGAPPLAVAPVSGLQTAPMAPAPVPQAMVNVTPSGVSKGGYGSAPSTSPASAPIAAPQAAVVRPPVAASGMQPANQISTGANQFMAPNLSGLTFGGS